MPGARCTRSLGCESREHTSVVTTGSPEQAQHFLRNGFNGFLRALPGDRLVVTVAGGLRVLSLPGRANKTSANLTPAPGRQDHTTSPSAGNISRLCALRSLTEKSALRSHHAL
jgi:hypothetical protein